ncbi:UDP-glucose 6-dehydrogenase TuaD [Geobacillus sp. BCO2]|nr:UDP-glucose 6-dehydrogenase TuaD [Geobacillus sp. BCO2]
MTDKKITVLGIAFKPNTDDTRVSPAEALIRRLSENGCTIAAYDPKATLSEPLARVTQVQSVYEAIQGRMAWSSPPIGTNSARLTGSK